MFPKYFPLFRNLGIFFGGIKKKFFVKSTKTSHKRLKKYVNSNFFIPLYFI